MHDNRPWLGPIMGPLMSHHTIISPLASLISQEKDGLDNMPIERDVRSRHRLIGRDKVTCKGIVVVVITNSAGEPAARNVPVRWVVDKKEKPLLRKQEDGVVPWGNMVECVG